MEDISRSTVVVLVVLTLAISMVGTWAVMNEISHVRPQYVAEPTVPQGQARISILSPEGYLEQTKPTANPVTAAVVSIQILDSEEYNG